MLTNSLSRPQPLDSAGAKTDMDLRDSFLTFLSWAEAMIKGLLNSSRFFITSMSSVTFFCFLKRASSALWAQSGAEVGVSTLGFRSFFTFAGFLRLPIMGSSVCV